ncbi:hypothetical protein RFF05_14455 [Bengtsoniella intestinalis]|uniref:hypothetical protein n=1 Tax=Bengtsoniella intestinalis TaxID=3073143 RepID=UPI00391EEB5A
MPKGLMDIRKLCARKPVDYFLRGVVVLLLVGVVIWGAMVGTNVTFYNHDPYITVNTGWVQVIDGEEIPLETAQDAVVPADGSAIVLQRTISDQADNQTMLFYTSHQEVTVYIDGDLEYELTCPAEFAFYGSTGRNWVEIPIREGMIGETLRLEFYTPFAAYSKVPNDLYYVVSDDIDTVRIDYMWMRNTVALALISLAVITYVNATIWKYHKLRRYLLVLADLYLFTGLWVCANTV